MSRIIKFRAWDKAKDCMILNYAHVGGAGKMYVAFDNGDMDLEVMQFTGLHDKNGKEIYEGDVIVFREQRYEVKWNDDWAMFDPVIKEEGGDTEVIGNIYENPELLQDKGLSAYEEAIEVLSDLR